MSIFERKRPRPRRPRLGVEALETRDAPATLTVNSNLDVVDHNDSLLTLREAVAVVNAGNTTGLSASEIAQISGTLGAGPSGPDSPNSGDTILLTGLSGQTITLDGQDINFTRRVAVTGPGAGLLTVSGGDQSRIFYVNNAVVEISGLTLSHAHADGGDDGQNGFDGGALFVDNANVTLNNVVLSDNVANQFGGAIANIFGRLTLNNCTFTNNSSLGGGAVFNYIAFDSGDLLTVSGCTFAGNSAAIGSTASPSSKGFGGAISNFHVGSMQVLDSTFDDNDSERAGGAIYSQGGAVISGSTFSNNTTGDSGGGIALLSVTNIINSTFAFNSAVASGGAVFNQGTLTLSTTTIVGNTANSAGASNPALAGGGLATAGSGTSKLFNTLLAGNKANTSASDVAGNLVDSTSMNNLVATLISGMTNGVNGNRVGNEGVGIRPLAAIVQINGDGTPKLADNGGPTKTVLLAAGSAAINSGSAAVDSLIKTTDQRGTNFPRQIGAVDIGAVETGLIVDTAADEDDGNYAAGDLSLREAIKLANLSAAADTITFAAALAGQTITLTVGELALTTPMSITGASVTLRRSSGASSFRIFNVAAVAVSLSGLTIAGGSVSGDGGGILNAGTLTVANSIISGNSAQNGGGVHNTGTLTLIRSTVSGNSASASGGGVSSSGTLTSTNVTFANNIALTFGGGLANTGTATLVSNTLAANTAGTNGGGLSTTSGASTTVHNSLIIGNTVLTAPADIGDQALVAGSSGNLIGDADTAGGLTDKANGNIIGNNGSGTLALAAILETNANGTPKLANNGGVSTTIALAQNSLAIGAALTSAPGAVNYDQREAARDQSTPDIGAYEVQHPLSPVGAPSTHADTFQPRPSINQSIAFVRGLYRLLLLRDADQAGQDGWVSQMAAGATRTQIAYGFVNSTENRTNQVTFFYRYFLHREPDAAGLSGWVDALQRGVLETSVLAGFLLSPEFTGQNDNASFVNLMYFAVLGRQADPAGFAGWKSQLDSGQVTRAQVGSGFLQSVEGIGRVINSYYASYLKRHAPQSDIDYYVHHVGQGLLLSQAAALILGSDEFIANAAQNLNP